MYQAGRVVSKFRRSSCRETVQSTDGFLVQQRRMGKMGEKGVRRNRPVRLQRT